VVNFHAPFDQQLFNVAVGQVVAQIPAHRDDDYIWRNPKPGER
jgi:hypothetical protein